MADNVIVQLVGRGNESDRIPVLVEILDTELEPRHRQWLRANTTRSFPVDPGLWGVRAQLASGAVVEKAVTVAADAHEDPLCQLPLYRLSTHETNEWAYFTLPISTVDKRSFQEPRYRDAWIRLWSSDRPLFWRIEPNQEEIWGNPVSRAPFGVVFRGRTDYSRQYALQVGGPKIPWKFVALPSDPEVFVLVRPASVADRRAHPLEVHVSSNLNATALMTLLRRGDAAQAQSLSATWLSPERPETAQLDYVTAIAIGYFLIHSSDFQTLDGWMETVENVSPPYLRDSPHLRTDAGILRLWRVIDVLRQRVAPAEEAISLLHDWFADFTRLGGLPLFAEGMRLMQKALLLFQDAPIDAVYRQAFLSINAYMGASDPFAVATTFLGARPDIPLAQHLYGIPPDGPFAFVYP